MCLVQSSVSVVNKNCICMIASKWEKLVRELTVCCKWNLAITVFEWYRHFKSGHGLWVGDQCSGCPFMLKNQCIPCCFAFRSVINSRRCRHVCIIVFPNFDWKFGHEACVCETHCLTFYGWTKKEKWMNICIDLLQQIEVDNNFMKLIVMCDETCVCWYNAKLKQQSSQC